MFIYLNKRAQSTLEYSVIIAVIVAALIAMQAYVKRGLQGRFKQASDDIGEQFSVSSTDSTTTTTTSVSSRETVSGGAKPLTTTTSKQDQERKSTDTTAKASEEDWTGK
jgi:uncharacterized protein (UPF0333 family)